MAHVTPAVELYGTCDCPYTTELREHLEWSRVAFVEYDVDADPQARRRLVTLTGERLVPVLVEDGRVSQVGWQGRACTVDAPVDDRQHEAP